MFRSRLLPLAAVMAASSLAVVPASAQQPRGSRLPSGLFGSGAAESGQVLSVGASAGGGYSRGLQFLPVVTTADSTFGHMSGNLRYSFMGSWLDASATAGSSGRYYANSPTRVPAQHVADAGVAVRAPLTPRTLLTLGQTASYQPLQTVSPFPGLVDSGVGAGEILPIDPELAFSGTGYASYHSTASVSHELSRRTAVFVDAGYRRSGEPTSTALSVLEGGGGVTRQLARGLAARAAYHYTGGTYSGSQAARFEHQSVDAGLDFNRALTLTRRMRLSFSTGSLLLSDGDHTQFTITGHARLTHAMGQSWRASVSYRRGADFLGTLRAPIVSDAVAAGLGGFLAPRLRVTGTVGLARGAVGLGQGNHFASSYATTGLTVAMSSYLGLDVTYSYYRSEFDNAFFLAPGVLDHFDRQSLRVSARVWVPLVTRTRRLNAAR